MAFIFGVATQEADLYRVFRDFMSGKARPGQWTYSGAGNGQLNNLIFPEGSAGLNETFTLTCESTATRGGTFGVVGSVSGVLPDAVVGTVFKHPLIEFYIDFGSVDFAVGDTFVIEAVSKPAAKANFDYIRPGVNGKTETLTLTCVTSGQAEIAGVQAFVPAVFEVAGSLSGALPNLTQGQEYSTSVASLLLLEARTNSFPYQVGDVVTIKTTINPLRAINQHWEILRQTQQVPSNQFGRTVRDTDSELVLRGPGLSNADSVYWGMTRAWSNAEAYAYWEHFGITGHVPTLTMQEQPTLQGGQSGPRPIHPMWSLNIPYVIIASGRCFKLITRSNIYYSQSYAGLFLPSTLPKYHAYPYFVGGTGDSRSLLWSALSDARSAFWDYQGDTSGGSGWLLGETVSWVRMLGSENSSAPSRINSNRCDPYGMNTLYDLRNNLDGTVPAFQVQLTPNRGFLDGVFAVPGRDGRQPEEVLLMRDGKRMLVTQNHHRSGFSDFCAFTLE